MFAGRRLQLQSLVLCYVVCRYTPTWGRYNLDLRPVVKALADSSINKKKWEIFHGLAEFRCIAGVVQNSEDLVAFEQLKVTYCNH